MLHIDEQALMVLLQAKSVKRIELRELSRGFGIFVHMDSVGSESSEGMLITARMRHQRIKTPRTWASVDSCIQFLRSKSPELPQVFIQLKEGGPHEKQ